MKISHTFSLSTFCSFSGLAMAVADAAVTVCKEKGLVSSQQAIPVDCVVS